MSITLEHLSIICWNPCLSKLYIILSNNMFYWIAPRASYPKPKSCFSFTAVETGQLSGKWFNHANSPSHSRMLWCRKKPPSTHTSLKSK